MGLIPKTKFDLDAAEQAVKAGYPAVEPVLNDLIEWLQDYNWPVAHILAPFLASIGLPLIPYIDKVFSTDDETWKYWMIVCLIGQNEDLFQHYQTSLIRIGYSPTEIEKENELDEVARDVLDDFGFSTEKPPSG